NSPAPSSSPAAAPHRATTTRLLEPPALRPPSSPPAIHRLSPVAWSVNPACIQSVAPPRSDPSATANHTQTPRSSDLSPNHRADKSATRSSPRSPPYAPGSPPGIESEQHRISD